MVVAVVTDSTAYLPDELVAQHEITVVPLHVVVGGKSYAEGVEISAEEVAAALRAFTPVTTSKPSPGELLDVYEGLIARGATEIVSVHLSGEMSATVGSAQLAASEASVPVQVLDSRSIGMAMGYAAVSAAQAAARGATALQAAAVAHDRAAAAESLFYVDTLEHLRRGGRIGRASALLGSALSIKPILRLTDDGTIEPVEKVRTTSRALAHIEERMVAHAADLPGALGFDIAVHHLDSELRAEEMMERLRARLPTAREVRLVELGAVVGAHVGPGTLAVTISPRTSTGAPPVIGASIS